MLTRIEAVIAAIWLGSAVFLMLASSAAFRAAPTPNSAADVVGAMLTRWHYVALFAPLALFVLELRKPRPLVLGIVFVAILLAAGQGFVDLKIRSIRFNAAVPISSMSATNPVRKQFGALHGISMMLLVLQAVAAAAVVAANGGRRPEPPPAQLAHRAPEDRAGAAGRTATPVPLEEGAAVSGDRSDVPGDVPDEVPVDVEVVERHPE